MSIFGSDHSIWDWSNEDDGYCPIDWGRSKSIFVFLKACDGVYDTPYYPQAIAGARAAGKLAAPYVWLYASVLKSPRAQAEFWYSRLKDEPLIVVDFESYFDFFPNYDDLYNAIERLRELGYAGKIIIYTGHWYWLAHGNTADYWKQFPIWLARYASSEPQVTPPWTGWDIWQFSATGNPAEYGITNGKNVVDENRFDGTLEELTELFGGEYVPPEPPLGGDMNYKVTCTNKVNIRSTGGASLGADIGDFLPGQVGQGAEVMGSPTGQYYCLKVTQGADVAGWVYSRWNGAPTYATIEEVAAPPPVGEETMTVTLTDDQTGDVWSGTITKQ